MAKPNFGILLNGYVLISKLPHLVISKARLTGSGLRRSVEATPPVCDCNQNDLLRHVVSAAVLAGASSRLRDDAYKVARRRMLLAQW